MRFGSFHGRSSFAFAASRLAWLVFALLCCAGVAAAAETQPGGPAVRFSVFSVKPIAGLACALRPGAAPQPLVFYPTARSTRHEYRGAMPLRFIDAATGAVVAEATIPPEMREALLLFSPADATTATGGRTTLRYHVAVLDDGAMRHGAGALSIVNLSGLPLSGTVNKDPVTLRAGLNPTLAVGRSAMIALRTNFKQRSYQSYSGTVTLTAKQRALLILFPPFYKGSLEVQSRLLVDEPGAAAR